jgi:hypothetical protein
MKQSFLTFLIILVIATFASAQEAKKLVKNADKDLAKFYQDQIGNADKLTSALDAINTALADETVKSDPEAWITKGKVHFAAGNNEVTKQTLNPAYKVSDLSSGIQAANAYQKAMELAIKKNHTKDALAGLVEAEMLLNNFGIIAYQNQDYKNAFENFNTYINVSEILKANKETSRLSDPSLKSDIEYYALATGGLGGVEDSKLSALAMKMAAAGTDKPLVYETLYKLTSPKDEAAALKYLEEGRLKFPDDSGLLFAEINYYLSKGKLDDLTGKLKTALAKEPDNISIYTTLGSVYDQLTTQERKNGNVEKVNEYFGLAYDYYNQAMNKDPKNFDAVYSLGALYYNKAAAMTEDLNKLSNDYSNAGTKKYNALKAEMDGVFEQALPYFIKAESLDANDLNTMIALKEIYARKGMLDKSAEYKTKIDAKGK